MLCCRYEHSILPCYHHDICHLCRIEFLMDEKLAFGKYTIAAPNVSLVLTSGSAFKVRC